MHQHHLRAGFKLVFVLVAVVAFIGLVLITSPATAGFK